MLRPNAQLRDLMLRANAEQIERIFDRAKEHSKECSIQGIEPTPPEKFLIEAFEVVLRENDDDGDADRARDDLFTKRQYARNYQEP
jgi:hypothetical protein